MAYQNQRTPPRTQYNQSATQNRPPPGPQYDSGQGPSQQQPQQGDRSQQRRVDGYYHSGFWRDYGAAPLDFNNNAELPGQQQTQRGEQMQGGSHMQDGGQMRPGGQTRSPPRGQFNNNGPPNGMNGPPRGPPPNFNNFDQQGQQGQQLQGGQMRGPPEQQRDGRNGAPRPPPQGFNFDQQGQRQIQGGGQMQNAGQMRPGGQPRGPPLGQSRGPSPNPMRGPTPDHMRAPPNQARGPSPGPFNSDGFSNGMSGPPRGMNGPENGNQNRPPPSRGNTMPVNGPGPQNVRNRPPPLGQQQSPPQQQRKYCSLDCSANWLTTHRTTTYDRPSISHEIRMGQPISFVSYQATPITNYTH
jgi:hypothetical protein